MSDTTSAEVGDKRPADEDIQNQESKSQRTSADADTPNAGASSSQQPSSLLPPPPIERALGDLSQVSGVKLELGIRLEVSWEVVDDSADAEDKEEGAIGETLESQESVEVEPEHVWWGGTLAELVGLDEGNGPVWKLVYDAKVLDGKEFAPEERNVIFCGTSVTCI